MTLSGRVAQLSLALLVAWCPVARGAPAPDAPPSNEAALKELRAQRDRARKAPADEAFAQWLAVADRARSFLLVPEDRIRLRDRFSGVQKRQNGIAGPIFDEALSKLSPLGHAALAATLPDPKVSAALIRSLGARRRMEEAHAECRDALGRWGDPGVAQACRDVPAGSGGWGGGGATHSVFAPELVFERSVNEDARASTWFHEGMTRGFGQGDLVRWMRVRSPGAETARDPRLLGQLQRTDPAGLYVGDPAGRIGAIALALSGSAQVPFLALGAPTEESVSPNPARPPGVRLIRLSPGPQMRARLLAGAARAQGVHRVALATPGEGGDMRLARALLEVASEFDLEVLPLEYTSGRRERRDDVARLRASGADAVALLGPGEESADWLIALKAGGKPLLVLGTEELDPAGFHEQARRAAEGAIFVRGSYTPVGAGSGVGSDEGPLPASAAECYVAGWLIADAIAHGADTPWTLEQALEKRIVEGDALDAWPAIPPTVARVEMSRIRNGQAEPLP